MSEKASCEVRKKVKEDVGDKKAKSAPAWNKVCIICKLTN
jgi:hypothetical protein